MLASTTVRVAIICFLFLYSFRFHGVGGGSRDNQQFGRATFGARFCPVGRALWSCPVTGAVLCVGRFLRGCLADNSMVRPPPSLCFCLFFKSFQVPFTLNFLIYAFLWGGRAVQGITNNLAGRPLGRGFVLWAVLCGHAPLPERFCVWAAFCGAVLLTTLWSALPPPFAYAFFSSLFKFLSFLNLLILVGTDDVLFHCLHLRSCL